MNNLTYPIERLMQDCSNYQEICDIFINLVDDLETKVKLKEILYNGRYNDHILNTNLMNRSYPIIEIQRRLSIAYLLITQPETFEILIENKINLFHGTNANALPSILKYGINSEEESIKNNINVITGEKSTRMHKTRDFVSLTDVLEIAENYSTLPSQIKNELLSFEVIIGTNVEIIRNAELNLKEKKFRHISSDIPEIGIKKQVPKECILTILVPPDKVEFVKKMVDNEQIKVLPLDYNFDKFYYLEDDSYKVNINYQDLAEFKKSLQAKKNKKQFKIAEIHKITLNRILSNINKQLKKIKSILNGGQELNYDRRKTK